MKIPVLSHFAPRRFIIAAVVFLLAMGVTLLAWRVVQLSLTTSASRAFEEQSARVENAILDRIRSYEQILRGSAGLFAASARVNRDEWRRYVATARIREAIPGIRGLNFAMRVAAADLAEHVGSVRREGFAEYVIQPAGERDEYYPVVWPEPLDERSRRLMGFDTFAEPVRRAAMLQARDSGRPTITAKVMLAAEASDAVPGFVYYYPIYARDQPIVTIEERRRAIIGFVFSPIRVSDLMQGLIGPERDVLELEIYDGKVPTVAGLMHDQDGARRATRTPEKPIPRLKRELNVGGHPWIAYFEATPKFMSAVDSTTPRSLLLAGLVMSVVITLLVWRLLTSEALALTASLHDGLTGLYNRRFLEASLKREQDRARRNNSLVAIVQFDLDFFKKLNDAYGHAAGDEVLRCVAEVLRAATRGEDIVCRYGGEEFTLILPGASRANAEARAVTIGKHIAGMQMSLAGQSLPSITISGGIAVYPEDGASLAAVLRTADHALLRAKREGRSRILVARAEDVASAAGNDAGR